MIPCVQTEATIRSDCTRRRDESIKNLIRSGIDLEIIACRFQVSMKHTKAMRDAVQAEAIR